MFEGGAGVVGRVDVDAFDSTGVSGEQGLEGFQIVALDQPVVGAGVAVGALRFQQPVGDGLRGFDGVVLLSQSRMGMVVELKLDRVDCPGECYREHGWRFCGLGLADYFGVERCDKRGSIGGRGIA